MKIIRNWFFFLFLSVLSAGCRIVIQVPPGGKVVSESGTWECTETNSCDIEILDATFDELFVAEADPGFFFKRWKRDFRHFCGGKTAPCALTTQPFADVPELLAVVEGDLVFYLSPIFELKSDTIIGTYQGEWHSTNTFPEFSGDVSLSVSRIAPKEYEISLDISGISIGGSDLPAQSVVATWEKGRISYSGAIGLANTKTNVEMSVERSGLISISMPGIPGNLYQSMIATGQVKSGSIELRLEINYVSGVTLKSRADLTKV